MATPDLERRVIVAEEAIKHHEDRIDDLEDMMSKTLDMTKDNTISVGLLVRCLYGVTGIILLAVIGAVLKLVIH